MANEYNIDSIQSLTFAEGVRKRISMYLGSNDLDGAYQAIKEIINNSTDEALAGYGNLIEITLDIADNSILVVDHGRGVPFGIRDNGENVLVSIFTKSHVGGKFDHKSYKTSSGLNGLGASCVCLSSSKFIVKSARDHQYAIATFDKGCLIDYSEGKDKNFISGTSVWFIPDTEVFTNGDITYDFEKIKNDIKFTSYLYPNITFSVIKKNGKEQLECHNFCATEGISNFVHDEVTSPLHKNIITGSATDGTDSVEIAFQWGVPRETSYVFVNGLLIPEGGSPNIGAKTALSKVINGCAQANFDGEQIRKNLFYVINCKVKDPSFANQTKSKINNPSLRTLASNAFTEAIKHMHLTMPQDFNVITALFKKLTAAENAAEKARDAILNHDKELAAHEKIKISATNKLREAKILGQQSILILTEGLSAGGSMSIGRQKAQNGDKIGILMLRGKLINSLSNSIEDILANEEIQLLEKALGISYGHTYDSKKLRYGKLAICSDADFDGSHIGLLIMAALQKLCPEFIKEGRLYWLKAPVSKKENGKNKYFFYSDKEAAADNHTGNIVFFKGIGQLSEQDLLDTLFNPKEQHLEQLVPSEAGISQLIELMGEDIQPRKDFITQIDFGGFQL